MIKNKLIINIKIFAKDTLLFQLIITISEHRLLCSPS